MANLNTCHRDIQTVLHEAIKYVDFSVVFGHRSEALQAELYAKGRDKDGNVVKISEVVTYKDGTIKRSKHNFYPSKAVDIIPWPSGWKDDKEFFFVSGVVQAIAGQMLKDGRITSSIKWGGRWKTLVDLPHFQL